MRRRTIFAVMLTALALSCSAENPSTAPESALEDVMMITPDVAADVDATDVPLDTPTTADVPPDLPSAPPQANPGRVTALESTPTPLGVLANDVLDGPITLSVVEPPLYGAVVVEDGDLVYTGLPGFNGADALTYAVTDGEGRASEARVRVGVFARASGDAPLVSLPRMGISPFELGVIVDTRNPSSVAVADHYMQVRGLRAEQRIEIAIDPETLTNEGVSMPREVFEALYEEIVAQSAPELQAYVLTWTAPWRVEGQSITSAVALGFDTRYFNDSGESCDSTAPTDYYRSASTRPFDDFGLRPTMALAGWTQEDALALIDRGAAADFEAPTGPGFMVRTDDVNRSVRFNQMGFAANAWEGGGLDLDYIDNSDGAGSNVVEDQRDVLFYFTGLTNVPNIATNTYAPGAIADHLTSFGGRLTSPDAGGQMSVLRWLEAGVTGSYGTVIEPCNGLDKFPDVIALLPLYYRGATLLEAYWKSVRTPGEGIFVGDPLARPWGRHTLRFEDGRLEIETTFLDRRVPYRLERADRADGLYTAALEIDPIAVWNVTTVVLEGADPDAFYRLVEAP